MASILQPHTMAFQTNASSLYLLMNLFKHYLEVEDNFIEVVKSE